MIGNNDYRFNHTQDITCADLSTFALEQERLKKRIISMRNTHWYLSGMLETINDGLIVVDADGIVVRVNRAFEDITGLRPMSCIGTNVRELHHIPKPFVEEVLEKKRAAAFIASVRGKDYLVKCNPVLDDNNDPVIFVCILEDIEMVGRLVSSLSPAGGGKGSAENNYEQLLEDDIIINSMAMRRVVELGLRISRVDTPVLISGETGVGKEVLAKIIHRQGPRRSGPFIRLNCGAIPGALIESELFGYEPGAFSGAGRNGKKGLIEAADGGTLFLDEIGEIPLHLQVKFLRVLQEREIQKLGGIRTKKIDFRLIAATNRCLEDMVHRKKFRPDLFYRLNVVPIEIPPLRERTEDIIPLAVFFLNRFNEKYGLSKKIESGVERQLIRYNWPGNIRELENTVERLVVTCESRIITTEDIITNTRIGKALEQESPAIYLSCVLQETERKLICQTMEHCRNTREMADSLGISQSAVVKKMRKHGIGKIVQA